MEYFGRILLCWKSTFRVVQKALSPNRIEEGQGTVGTRLNVSHDAATPVGMKVWAESCLTEIDGRRLVFKVRAYDECGLIGQGTHERFIIKKQRFLEKAEAKKG